MVAFFVLFGILFDEHAAARARILAG